MFAARAMSSRVAPEHDQVVGVVRDRRGHRTRPVAPAREQRGVGRRRDPTVAVHGHLHEVAGREGHDAAMHVDRRLVPPRHHRVGDHPHPVRAVGRVEAEHEVVGHEWRELHRVERGVARAVDHVDEHPTALTRRAGRRRAPRRPRPARGSSARSRRPAARPRPRRGRRAAAGTRRGTSRSETRGRGPCRRRSSRRSRWSSPPSSSSVSANRSSVAATRCVGGIGSAFTSATMPGRMASTCAAQLDGHAGRGASPGSRAR